MSDKKHVTNKKQVRHTHATINGIEDAEANVLNVIAELEIAMLRAKRLLEILQTVRQSPYAYQRGSQKRPRRTILHEEKDDEQK